METTLEQPTVSSTVVEKAVIRTDYLKDIVAKAVKVCSFIEAFPLTGALQVKVSNGTLSVVATDNINTIDLVAGGEVSQGTETFKVAQGDLNVLVDAKIFSTLVSKLTQKFTELEVKDGNLVLKSNGVYEFKIISEEDGSKVEIPIPEFDFSVASKQVTNLNIKSILVMNKSCKSDTKEQPSIFNYYLDNDKVLTTDFYRMCYNPVSLFSNPVVLTPEVMELVPLIVTDKVDVYENSNSVVFKSNVGTFYGRKAPSGDLSEFPAEGLMESLQGDFPYTCMINKTEFTNAIDRVCLFTGPFDNNEVKLEFLNDRVSIYTNGSSAKEVVKYLQEATNTEAVQLVVDGQFLKTILLSLVSEDLKLSFGEAIKLESEGIVQILSTVDTEE